MEKQRQFAEFITEEASIACDPVTSLGSLRGIPEQEEKEREKGSTMNERKKRSHAATPLASDTEDNESLSCFLCKRNSHVLAECRTFGVKPVGEKQEFVKKNGLCFGCLQHGLMSKGCTQKSTCKTCHKRHPTSLHMEQKQSSEESMTKTLEKSNKSKDVTKPEKEAVCSNVSNIASECMSTNILIGKLLVESKKVSATIIS